MSVISAAGHWLARTGLAPGPEINGTAAAATATALPRVVVVTDLSQAGINAAWRAGLVARDRKLPLHVLGLPSGPGKLADAQARLHELAGQLREQLVISVTAQSLRGDLLCEGTQAAGGAGLLVMAPTPANLLGDRVLGSQAEQLARRGRVPVLIVRRPALTSYRDVLVPVELKTEASALITAGRALSRHPRMNVLHVLCIDHEEVMRLADVPGRVIRAERQKAAQRTRRAVAQLIATAGAHLDVAAPAVGFGNVSSGVLETARATGAELLVLGQRPRRSLADAVFGGVTQRVLRATRADVLVVPLPPPARLVLSSNQHAGRRADAS